MRAVELALYEEERKRAEKPRDQTLRSAEQYDVRRVSDALSRISHFVKSPSFRAIGSNFVLMLGPWGIGKTHFLCDITAARERAGALTVLVLAHTLPETGHPLDAVAKASGLAETGSELLTLLDLAARETGGRALLIVDGINEGDRAAWSATLSNLKRQVGRYAHVAIVLSCRTPYEQKMFTNFELKSVLTFWHPGFQDIEVDAQSEFFRYYDIPSPYLPLLAEEFSRPLFLKLICKTLQGFTEATTRRKINEFASGHKGMAKIFEDFVVHLSKQVEVARALPSKSVWRLLKGSKNATSGELDGIAVAMAEKGRDWLTRTEAHEITAEKMSLSKDDAVSLLDLLVAEGLLAEDLVYKTGDLADVYRLPYQRFSDHLISRHLLERYLDTSSVDAVRRCFYKNRPLGRIFELDRWGHQYAQPGLAAALMLEFPERMKRVVPEGRELVFYLPRQRRRVSPLVNVFLEGLIWRSSDSFSDQTHYIIDILLSRGFEWVQHEVLDTLLCLSTRTAHGPLRARLVRYLDGLSLVQRDLHWSECLRVSEASSSAHRLLGWIEKTRDRRTPHHVSEVLIEVLEWFLTTTSRPLRDRATRALVLEGEKHPDILFSRTIASFTRNDPYVPERMLAAAYGVLMRNRTDRTARWTQHCAAFARDVYDQLFARRAPARTKHILTREYALGIIRICQEVSPRCLAERDEARLLPPFGRYRGPIPPAERILDEKVADAKSAVHIDFENYTIGGLVEGRSNYDFDHTEYVEVRRQILWRVLDLGYTSDAFKQVDAGIARSALHHGRSDRPEKTDRYGKKYSWIAYFEVAGMRQELERGDVLANERISDIDIDPSFPDEPMVWNPAILDELLFDVPSPAEWVKNGPTPDYTVVLERDRVAEVDGPWVLLNGFIEERSKDADLGVFTFLRGLLLDEADTDRLERLFSDIKYPGNQAIPGSGSDYYTFAGEVPWSPRFANSLYDPHSSTWQRHLGEAFEETRWQSVRKRFGDLTALERQQLPGLAPLLRIIGLVEPREKLGRVYQDDDIVKLKKPCRVPGIQVELPIWSYAFESYHSITNQTGGINFPAPSICQHLRLSFKNGGSNLVDAEGNLASLYCVSGGDKPLGRSHLFFLRRDLLERYLRATKTTIAWTMWGERELQYEMVEQHRKELAPIHAKHQHIHRRIKIGLSR